MKTSSNMQSKRTGLEPPKTVLDSKDVSKTHSVVAETGATNPTTPVVNPESVVEAPTKIDTKNVDISTVDPTATDANISKDVVEAPIQAMPLETSADTPNTEKVITDKIIEETATAIEQKKVEDVDQKKDEAVDQKKDEAQMAEEPIESETSKDQKVVAQIEETMPIEAQVVEIVESKIEQNVEQQPPNEEAQSVSRKRGIDQISKVDNEGQVESSVEKETNVDGTQNEGEAQITSGSKKLKIEEPLPKNDAEKDQIIAKDTSEVDQNQSVQDLNKINDTIVNQETVPDQSADSKSVKSAPIAEPQKELIVVAADQTIISDVKKPAENDVEQAYFDTINGNANDVQKEKMVENLASKSEANSEALTAQQSELNSKIEDVASKKQNDGEAILAQKIDV